MTNHPRIPLSRSGFCQYPSTSGHDGCRKNGCDCTCHLKEET